MSDFVDSVVKHEDREFRAPKAPIEETFDEVRTIAKGGGGTVETYSDKATRDRQLPQSARDLIARMEAEEDDVPGETDEEAAAGGEETAELVAEQPDGAAKPAETPADPAKAAAAAPTITGIDPAEHERVIAANKALLEELEAERGKAKPSRSVPKHLDGLDNAYIEDPIAALRRVIASALDVEDLKDPKVDDELRALYTDLTATTLGVTPDDNHVTKRESARTRLLWERDKKERKATEQTSAEQAKAQAEAEQAKKAAEYIGTLLQVKDDGGASIADEFPMLIDLAETFEGMKPEAALVRTLQHATKTGKLKLTGNDRNDLRAAAKMLEEHYDALGKKIDTARSKRKNPSQPTPSTATPNGEKPSAATPSTSNETRQKTGARTLTNADASAAPAAPPAPKQTPKKDERPKFKSKKEEQDWALRHLRK